MQRDNQTFATEVYPGLRRYLRKCLGPDDEIWSIAMCLAWYIWANRKVDYSIRLLGYFTVRQIRAGRDLPGVLTNNHQPDALDYMIHGGSMKYVRDRKPRPEKVVMNREEVASLYRVANRQERLMLDMLMAGETQRAIAKRLGFADPHVIIEMKRRLFRRRTR